MAVFLVIVVLLATFGITTEQILQLKSKKPDDYDAKYQEIFEKILSEENQDWRYFDPEVYDDIFNIYEGEQGDCKWSTSVKTFYMLKNLDDGTTYPIIQSQNLTQQFKVTQCGKNTGACYEGFGLSKLNLTSICTNSYRTSSVYIYDTKEKKVLVKYVNLPADCICTIKKT